MVRKLIVALAIAITCALLAIPAVPGRVPAGGGRGSHRDHHHSRHFTGFIYAPYPSPYGFPNCWWEEGHWVDQLYIDKYGNETKTSPNGSRVTNKLLPVFPDSSLQA